jgi:hypothetical protein
MKITCTENRKKFMFPYNVQVTARIETYKINFQSIKQLRVEEYLCILQCNNRLRAQVRTPQL